MAHIPTGRRGALAAASAAVVCLGTFAALGPDCESAGAGRVALGAPGPAGSAAMNMPTATAPSPVPSATPPGSPDGAAHLAVGAVVRTATGDRWCENVTVTLANTGDSPATSGTLLFGTHIIGPLGIDWATIGSSDPVPVPLAGGARSMRTWTVCVDAWRVPPGMHAETRDVSVRVP
ncbi:hypothetical protein ABZ883_09470 [Streptomyces sp. NPDC046977]|uniref:hypothetical protein n=1 Tax=Streptomyces sp. NPDC046977 TaxID=3154703 RepID=UPI00340FA6AC